MSQIQSSGEAPAASLVGSLGVFTLSDVLTLLAENGLLDRGLKARVMTLPDRFQEHDKPERLYAAAGLDAKGIVAKALEALAAGARKPSLTA